MDVREIISDIRRQPGKDIWLVGGGEVIREFIAADLVDDIVLSIQPLNLRDRLPDPGSSHASINGFVTSAPVVCGLAELRGESLSCGTAPSLQVVPHARTAGVVQPA